MKDMNSGIGFNFSRDLGQFLPDSSGFHRSTSLEAAQNQQRLRDAFNDISTIWQPISQMKTNLNRFVLNDIRSQLVVSRTVAAKRLNKPSVLWVSLYPTFHEHCHVMNRYAPFSRNPLVGR